MSKQVDERVVSMQFDNSDFEKNVSTSMGTIDKLKRSLNFEGLTKGLDNIKVAAGKCDVSPLSSGIETVKAQFSALQVMGVTALSNITNSAVDAGKKIAAALTIEPIKNGFMEYETQINAIKTIKANSPKATMEDINTTLDDLNEYADLTIYNFGQMTDAIGKFTAAGVNLDDSAVAIKGLANVAAGAGVNNTRLAGAYIQVSQALSSGIIRLQDWNSLQQAGMGGVPLQEELKKTARELGIAVDAAIKKNGSFRESLKEGWLTNEVFIKTMKRAASTNNAWGASLTSAATDITTFTQLVGVAKEALGTGWANTWKLIIGDYDQAKKVFTEVGNELQNVISKMTDRRNDLLGEVLNSKWDTLSDKIKKAGISTDSFKSKLKEVAKSHGLNLDAMIKKEGSLANVMNSGKISKEIIIETLKKFSASSGKASGSTEDLTKKLKTFQDVVDKVWKGEFKNAPERYKLLAKAGYDYKKVQQLVNKTVDGHRLTLADLSDEQLKNVGYTKEQIKAIHDLAAEAEKSGTSLNDLIESMGKPSGRDLLIDSFKNLYGSIRKIVTAVSDAWREIFDPIKSSQIYNVIEAIHKFSESLIMSTETAGKVKRSLKGVFAILDIIRTIAGGAVSIAFKVLTTILGKFDLNILDATAYVGDLVVKFRDWLLEGNFVIKVISKLVDWLILGVKKLKEWFNEFKELPVVQKYLDRFRTSISNLKKAIQGIDFSNLLDIGKNLIAGIKKGIEENMPDLFPALKNLCTNILDKIKELLGIHSPSTKTYEMGKNLIEGFQNGITDWLPKLKDTAARIAVTIRETLSKVDWGKLMSMGLIAGTIVTLKQFADAIDKFAGPAAGLGKIFGSVGSVIEGSVEGVVKILKSSAKVIKSFAKVVKAYAFSIKAKAIKDIAIALAILVGSIAVLALIPEDQLWGAVKVFGVIAAILVGLVGVIEGLSMASKKMDAETIDFAKLSIGLLGISASLILMARVIKTIGKLDPDQAKQGFLGLAGMVVALGVVIAAYGLLVKGHSAKNIEKAGVMLLAVSVSMLILAKICKTIGGMTWPEMGKAAAGMAGLVGIITLLMLVTQLAGKRIDKVGPTLLKISASMLILAGVCKIINSMSWAEMGKAATGMLGLVGIITLLILITKLAGPNIDKVGATLVAISASMAILVYTVKLIASVSKEDLDKGIVTMIKFTGIIALLVAATKLAGNNAPKIAATLIAMSLSIGILAGIAIILSYVELKNLAKGIIAVYLLGRIVASMTAATKGAADCKGTLIGMAVAIGIMAASIAVLSFIDPEKLIAPTIAMSMLMGMFAVIANFAGTMNKVMAPLIVMTVAIGVMAGSIFLLAQLPVESAIGSATALSMLMLSLSAAMFIIGKANVSIKEALKGVVGLLALCVPLAALVGILYLLQNVETSIPKVAALSMLATALTLLLIPLTMVGAFIEFALLGVVGLLSMTVPLLALVGILAIMEHIENATENSKILTTMITTIGNLLIKLAIVGPLALIGVTALTALVGLMVAIGGLVTALGVIVTAFPQIEKFVNKGISLLITLANGLGRVIGAFIGGVATEIASSLPVIGVSLSKFMANLTPFIAGAKMIDQKAVDGIKSLAKMLATITGAAILEKITSFVTKGSSVEDFAKKLVPFGKAMVEFSKTISGKIDEKAVNAAANAGKAMAELSKALPGTGGWAQKILGTKDMDAFGKGLATFGEAIIKFSTKVSGKNAINLEAIELAKKAGISMVELVNELPKSSGWAQKALGSKDIESFGKGIEAFGKSIVNFSSTVSAKDSISVSKIKNAATAGLSMVDLVNKLPKSEGWAQKVFGSNDIETFGNGLELFGNAIVKFSGKVSAEGAINLSAIETAKNAGLTIIDMAKTAPGKEALDKLKNFGEQSIKYGESLAKYSKKITDINFDAITKSKTASSKIVSVVQETSATDFSKVDSLKENLEKVGTALKTFSDKAKSLKTDAMVKAASTLKTVCQTVKGLAGADFSVIGSLNTALGSISKKSVDNFINAFKDSSPKALTAGKLLIDSVVKGISSGANNVGKAVVLGIKSAVKAITSSKDSFRNYGKIIIGSFASGVTSGASVIGKTFATTLSKAAAMVKTYYQSFDKAGQYLGQGLVKGMNAKQQSAYNAGLALGQKAAEGVKKGAQEHSPSKLTIKYGEYLGEGLVIGMNSMSSSVSKAGIDMGENATANISSSISKIKDTINNGMSDQPTIRPVLDMSSVRSTDVKLGANVTTSLSKPIDSLSGIIATAQTEINASNQEVVSAINSLREDLNKLYTEDDQEVALYIDSKKLASSIAKPMNRQLNILSRRGAY